MKAYCINLKERKDRLEKFYSQEFPFKVTRFDALRGNFPAHGNILSHLGAMSKCKDEILIFEDDCVMTDKWDLFYNAYAQLPENWDCLFLGANLHSQLDQYSDNLFRLKDGWSTHAVLYKKKLVDHILTFDANKILEDKHIDTFLQRRIQPFFNCFIVHPILSIQEPGFSDIINGPRSYEEMIPNFYKFTK